MTQTDELDRIERQIDIDSSPERVWQLVSRPGWWINEGEVDPEPSIRREGDLDVVSHPKFGEFRLRTVAREEPRYVAYRWIEQDDPTGGVATLVEFWIDEHEDGGVTLRVAESGFTQLGKDHAAVTGHVEESTEGWETELAAARAFLTSRTG